MKTRKLGFVLGAALLFVAGWGRSADDLAVPEGGSSSRSAIDAMRGALESRRLIPKETRQPHGRAVGGDPDADEGDVWYEESVEVAYSPSKDAFMAQVAACLRERRCLASADATKRTVVTLENLVRPAFARREETYLLTPCDAASAFFTDDVGE